MINYRNRTVVFLLVSIAVRKGRADVVLSQKTRLLKISNLMTKDELEKQMLKPHPVKPPV